MPEDDKAPDFRQILWKWVLKHFGVRGGIVMLATVCGILWVFTHWDAVSKLPIVASAISLLTRWEVPKADTNRFSILVAHLGERFESRSRAVDC